MKEVTHICDICDSKVLITKNDDSGPLQSWGAIIHTVNRPIRFELKWNLCLCDKELIRYGWEFINEFEKYLKHLERVEKSKGNKQSANARE